MNNKKLGTAFEREVCEMLKKEGYWVHFIAPDNRGAQPFDIIAVKDGIAAAIECKTLDEKQKYFSIDRIEENQRMAFDLWVKCGNLEPQIFIEHGEDVIVIGWFELQARGKVELND